MVANLRSFMIRRWQEVTNQETEPDLVELHEMRKFNGQYLDHGSESETHYHRCWIAEGDARNDRHLASDVVDDSGIPTKPPMGGTP